MKRLAMMAAVAAASLAAMAAQDPVNEFFDFDLKGIGPPTNNQVRIEIYFDDAEGGDWDYTGGQWLRAPLWVNYEDSAGNWHSVKAQRVYGIGTNENAPKWATIKVDGKPHPAGEWDAYATLEHTDDILGPDAWEWLQDYDWWDSSGGI